MKAIVQHRYGSADVLEYQQVDKPAVGENDVRIRVQSAGVHIGDWHVMVGEPYLMRIIGFGFRGPKARVRGMDVAGTVEAVGAKVTRFQIGDEVYGTCDGAFAEYAIAREATLAHKPSNLSYEQASVVPTSATTALQALRDAGSVKPGQRVLIIGASGGVGLFAVQIAKAFGALVTGVCSTSKMDLVRSVGADDVIDYTKEDVTKIGKQYDLILDMGGNRSLSQLRRALTPTGTLVLVGGEGGDKLIGAMSRSMVALMMNRFVSQNLRMVLGTTNAADLQFLTGLIEAGTITPVIDKTYDLSDASAAIHYLSSGHARGKLAIRVAGDTVEHLGRQATEVVSSVPAR